MDINKMKSDLRMENFHFVECSVSRSAIIENGSLSFDLNKEINELENGDYSVVLTLTIHKENNDLNVRVVAAAMFSMDSDDVELIRSIMETNTVAIMFPFIRSQVSLLTTQPGMIPIVLPPINTAKFKSN
ncbi:MAG: preprotein translocase subunit SecB [Ruminococcaceae bacterium]|nr:preprotein translocase subunit SecB [Oscillospiraceae bacterium]